MTQRNPISPTQPPARNLYSRRLRWRTASKTAFFLLFLLAPTLNIFRFDLTLGHAFILGFEWHIPIDFQADAVTLGLQVLLFLLLPVVSLIVLGIWISWKYGRIYCGWLCPHFSVVEWINKLMEKHLGKTTLYEPRFKAVSGRLRAVPVFLAALAMGFVWALALLSYLLPPLPLYRDVFTGQAGLYSYIFLGVATGVFVADFLFARHLFCKYGCAIGLAQSFVWMTNRKAWQVRFPKSRAKLCQECDDYACEQACPMRLNVRSLKRVKFACTQCQKCIAACEAKPHVQGIPVLQWNTHDESSDKNPD